MKMQEFEGYTYVDGGVCAAKGFKANGLNCGLNPNKEKNDLGLFVSDVVCNTAAVYTTNKVKGAPILVMQEYLKKTGGKAQACVVNSKNANTCNADGIDKAKKITQLAADCLHMPVEYVMVSSTGVIGQPIPIEPFENSMEALVSGLSYDGNDKATNAIMTTDTVPKQVAVTFDLDGTTITVGGMAKGSGMIHPNMATTLNFVTTDMAISSQLLQKALSELTVITYNCLSVDGDTSTNDTLCVMANGLAGNEEVLEENGAYKKFYQALYIVLMNLTRMLAADGEGATKLLECTVEGAVDQEQAIIVAKSIIRSPLVKTAMFGADANWGRILCAIGYAESDFDINKVDVDIVSNAGKIEVCRDGSGIPFSEEVASQVLAEDEIFINVTLGEGNASAKAWGCDLTYDYVKINGDYRT